MTDDWNPKGPPDTTVLRLKTGDADRHIIGNFGTTPITVRATSANRFVFPPGVTELIMPPHSTATFIAKRPSLWRRIICFILRRTPMLRWRWLDTTALAAERAKKKTEHHDDAP